MDAVYTDLESVRKAYMGMWKDPWDEWTEDNIPLVSSILRKVFKDYGLSLDVELAAGNVERLIVQMVANNMLIRRLSTVDNGIGAGGVDYKSLSMGVGPYSVAVTPATNGSVFQVRSDEKRFLGLPMMTVGGLTISYFSDGGDQLDPLSLSDGNDWTQLRS